MLPFLDRRTEYFLKISEQKSFSQASKKIGLTQPSLSAAIQSLEADLGLKLFERRANGVVLTAAGKAFRTTVSKHLESISADLAEHLKEQKTPIVKFGASGYVMGKYVNPVLKKFKHEFGFERHVLAHRSLTLFHAVENQQLDFAFVSWTRKPVGLDSIEIKPEPIAIVGHKKRFGHIAHVRKLEDLSKEPWVYFPKPQYDLSEYFSRFQTTYVVGDSADLRDILLGGHAIGELQLDTLTDTDRKLLVTSPAPTFHPNVKLYLIFKSDISSDLRNIAERLAARIKSRPRPSPI